MDSQWNSKGRIMSVLGKEQHGGQKGNQRRETSNNRFEVDKSCSMSQPR